MLVGLDDAAVVAALEPRGCGEQVALAGGGEHRHLRADAGGRIGDQDTLTTNPATTDEYDTHRVAVVRGPGPITFKD